MATLDEREQQTLSKRCTKCGEVKPLEDFRKDKHNRDGRYSHCRVCEARRARERHWKKQGVPPEHWPQLHREVDARAARRNSVPDGFKRCHHCGEVRPLEEFTKDKSRRDGRKSHCRTCDAKRQRERRWQKQGIPESEWARLHARHALNENMRHLNAIFGGKWCPECEQHLPREYFHRDSSSADGRQGICKTCQSARFAAYLRTPAGRAADKGSRHRRRARLRNLPTDGTTPRDWAAWAEEHEWFQCHLCGGDLNADDEIHWDHVEPVSKGGAGTVLHNMRAAHAWCNLSRGNRPIDEWRAAMGLTEEIP